MAKSDTIPGRAYLEAVESSLEEATQEERRGGDLVLNSYVLCVDPILEAQTFEEYDEETGEVSIHEMGYSIIKGHKFVITTGGPHAEFRTYDNGESYEFFYCDWFGSDEYRTEVSTSMCEAFNLWFECGVPEGQELGAVIHD